MVEEALGRYPTSLAEDQQALASDPALTPFSNRRHAVIQVREMIVSLCVYVLTTQSIGWHTSARPRTKQQTKPNQKTGAGREGGADRVPGPVRHGALPPRRERRHLQGPLIYGDMYMQWSV